MDQIARLTYITDRQPDLLRRCWSLRLTESIVSGHATLTFGNLWEHQRLLEEQARGNWSEALLQSLRDTEDTYFRLCARMNFVYPLVPLVSETSLSIWFSLFSEILQDALRHKQVSLKDHKIRLNIQAATTRTMRVAGITGSIGLRKVQLL